MMVEYNYMTLTISRGYNEFVWSLGFPYYQSFGGTSEDLRGWSTVYCDQTKGEYISSITVRKHR